MYTAEANVRIDADQNTAWNYVSNYQNFDTIMSNVKEVKLMSSDTSEWQMSGPLGVPVSWKAVTTENTPPRRLAWRSTEGSLETNGFITVEPDGEGSRVTVHVEYTPPLGAVGEAVASLFKDPQGMLEHDLAQLDALISGKTPGQDPGAAGGMAGFARTAERGEKIMSLGVNSPGGMTGYGVAEREAQPDLDPDGSRTEPRG